MKNKFLLLIIASQLSAFGMALRAQDADDKGTDDLIGHILQTTGSVISAMSASDDKGVRKYLRIIADTIYDFLGLTPPVSPA